MEIIDDIPDSSEEKDINQLIVNGYDFKIGDYVSQGYDLFKENMGPFIGFTVLVILINVFLVYTLIGEFLVQGPLAVGFAIVAHRIAKKRGHEFGDFFKGFDFFVPLLLAGLIMTIFIGIGFIFLIIPGIYLAVAYFFTYQLIVFRKMEFWEAMETSRKLISKEWFSVFGFIIVLGLINFAGALCLGVGLLFTIPITACAAYVAYSDIVGTKSDHP